MQYFHLKGLNSANIKIKLDFTLTEFSLSFATVTFIRQSLNEAVRAAMTNMVLVDQIRWNGEMVSDDRWEKVQQVADVVDISKSVAYRILTKNLNMKAESCAQDGHCIFSQ